MKHYTAIGMGITFQDIEYVIKEVFTNGDLPYYRPELEHMCPQIYNGEVTLMVDTYLIKRATIAIMVSDGSDGYVNKFKNAVLGDRINVGPGPWVVVAFDSLNGGFTFRCEGRDGHMNAFISFSEYHELL